MNYRHAFHAGNFADVHKHAVLARILTHLRLKPATFRVIDSHAGAGRYDLAAPDPIRGGEWRLGIARLWAARAERAARAALRQTQPWALLAPYLDAVAALNQDGELRAYPGSPLVVQHLLRAHDRLIACEIEPQAAAGLAAALRGDPRAKVLALDGWTAIGAFVPPKERRGLILIDPPFEDAGDFARLSVVLETTHRKWPTGIYMLWYPIKDREAPDALARRLRRSRVPKLLRCELSPGALREGASLVGSGLLVVNPPFTLEADLHLILPVLGNALSRRPSWRIDWLTPKEMA